MAEAARKKMVPRACAFDKVAVLDPTHAAVSAAAALCAGISESHASVPVAAAHASTVVATFDAAALNAAANKSRLRATLLRSCTQELWEPLAARASERGEWERRG